MGLNINLIKRTTKTNTSDIIHSSGYVSGREGAVFGSSDNTTFSERQQIEQQRKLIKGYRNAQVARGTGILPRTKSYEDEVAVQAKIAEIEQNERLRGTSKQEFNLNQDRGGLRQYDTRSRENVARYGSAREASGAIRAERASRFDAKARPVPKTGRFGR